MYVTSSVGAKKESFVNLLIFPEEVNERTTWCKYTCTQGNRCKFVHDYPPKPLPSHAKPPYTTPVPTIPFPSKSPAQKYPFRCETCDISCTSLEQLENHTQGKRHKQLERKVCDVERITGLVESLQLYTADDKLPLTNESIELDFDLITSHSPALSPSHSLDTQHLPPVLSETQPESTHFSKAKHKRKLKLYCGNCGSNQDWDFGKDEQRDLEAKRDESGGFVLSKVSKGVTQGCVRFTGRSKSTCSACHKQIMRSPISAVCVHCNALLDRDWTPYKWRCTNLDGKAIKRFLPSLSSDENATDCSPCGKHLHSAIAGKLINVDGRVPDELYVKGSGDCYGFVMVH